ncbi:hypothetical protein R1sor_023122 [Riccia sorocarpa]|uniref:Disease resistance R13L4/SHOC-2-like LRR domain-containing protein n=1 Tax=Riccia sorocarpa TaxID=122646 RepID=A0ABD3GNB4_9MARC
MTVLLGYVCSCLHHLSTSALCLVASAIALIVIIIFLMDQEVTGRFYVDLLSRNARFYKAEAARSTPSPRTDSRDFILTENDHESQVDNSGGGRYGASTSSDHQPELSHETIKRCNLGRPGLRLREGSSRYGENYMTVNSSHFYVCRPPDKTSNTYQRLQTLIQEVLRRVESERKPYLTVPKVIVGFDGLVNEVLEEHLRTHKLVGICGMGGIGKTTLAKLIFNRMRHRAVPVRKADQVYEDVWYQVKGKSLLLIFDDVDSDEQVEILQEIADENGCIESRFILTSRDSELLRGDDIRTICPNHLGKEDAEKLLSAHAFPKGGELSESLRKIIQEVIEACEGLPLTLEILGKHLRSRRTELWTEIPNALRRCTKDIANLEHRLWARLHLSYDGLPGNEVQNMFLDIASFFILRNEYLPPFGVDDAIMAWSSIYGGAHNRLQILEDRSLVTVRRYEDCGVTRMEFYMHEHLRRMGQKIAREKGRSLDLFPIRSSETDEKVVFQGSKDELGKIVAHKVMISRKSMAVLAQSCSFCIMHELWPKLAGIQFMDLDIDVMDCCEQCRSRRVLLPSTLVLLRLLAGTSGMDELSVEAGGNSTDDLIMRGTLSLSACTSLVKLELANLLHLGGLNRLHQLRVLIVSCSRGVGNCLKSLGKLRRLEHLELFAVNESFELPVSFGQLTALQYLRIISCKVRSIPVSFSNLTNLRFLEIDEIVGSQAISIGSFPQLRRFRMKCWAIADIATVFQKSTALESLALEFKEAVPDIFGHLKNLREFRLGCSGLENNLVESWGKLTSLEYLFLVSKGRTSELEVRLDLQSDDRSLEISLKGKLGPPGIFEPLPVFLTRVEHFTLACEHGSTTALARNMMNLKHLAVTVSGEQPVQDIFGRLGNLRKFMLVCRGVENSLVQSLGKMINLEDLTIEIQSQQTVRDIFRYHHKLRKFQLVCSGVENSLVKSLGNMMNLEDLSIKIQGQQVVQDIFGHLQNLRRFRLACSGVENNLMGSLGKLSSLEVLDLNLRNESAKLKIEFSTRWQSLKIRLKGEQAESSILEPLPVFLRGVDTLDLRCEHGAQIEVVRDMIHLESFLILVEGPGAVPDVFGGLQKLRLFSLECHAVKDNLEGSLEALSSLQQLDLRCETMERLPHAFGCFSTLESLCISCPSLPALPPTMGNFIRLRSFKIFASGLQSLPDSIGQLLQLRKLSIFACDQLTTLPESLGQLSKLVS